jgi:MipA family protein
MLKTPKLIHSVATWLPVLLMTSVLAAQAQPVNRLSGDVGAAVYRTPAITHTTDRSAALLPYVYADYGPLYARINTVGYKALPLGAGHLEVAARISLEGYTAAQAGIQNRANPLPVGIGTFQETPYGAFFAYGFHDPKSGGNLVDLMYAAQFSVGAVTFYPQLGLERRSAQYVQHLYGVSSSEASASGVSAYAARSSTTPNVGLTAEYALTPQYSVSYQLRKSWLDSAITDSPLVHAQSQTTTFVALTRSFR